jgi:hypothetical protein
MAAFAKAVEHATLKLNKMLSFLGLGPEKEKSKEETEAIALREKRDREVMDAEWKVINAKGDYDKKIAKQELETAKRRQLDAEVAEKYAKDRASGKTGAGMGGTQLRADGSEIRPGDEDYEAPKPAAAAPASGGMGMPTGGGAPGDLSYKDYIKFTGNTGSEEHFNKLQPQVREAFAKMARDYNQLTGDKLQINSAFRSPEEQAGVDSGTNPKAAPGKSKHNIGMAVDIQSSQVRELGGLGLLQQYGFKTLANDPPHIFMRDGGIAKGPDSGYPATLHGTEAVIPLKNGAVPVSLDLTNSRMFKNMQSQKTPNLENVSDKTSKISDIDTLKTIAVKLGAADETNKKITDPSTWKDIINSGMSMNYNMGIAEISSKMIPGIGKEISNQIQELTTSANSRSDNTVNELAKEFKTVMLDAVKNIAPGNSNSAAMTEQLSLLATLVREQQASNSIQEKLLRAAAS